MDASNATLSASKVRSKRDDINASVLNARQLTMAAVAEAFDGATVNPVSPRRGRM
jgi:hypothetical protein